VANTDIVLPGHLYATPDLAEALDIVRQNPGVFGTGGTPTQLLRVLEWFVEPPCILVLRDSAHGALSSTHGCVCVGDAFQFHGIVVEPNVPKVVGHLRYDVSLAPGNERVHLDHYSKDEYPSHPPMSMTPHLRRAYEAMERLGIRTLDLEAGLQSGPTFWARAGVDFRYGRALLEHLELLAMLLAGESAAPSFSTPEDVRVAFPGRTASIEQAHSRSLALSLAASAPVWVINPLDFLENDLGIPIDVQRPLGEAILFAISPWDGRVDVSDPGTSDARYRAFLGIKDV
jgi:hypothetical protein